MELLQVSATATPYQNDDVLPLPPARRTWTRRTFVCLWLSLSFSFAAWSGASTSLAIGLTVGQSIAVCAVSNITIALAMFLSGQAGSKWHVPFPVVNRTCWGIRGSWFVVLNRIIVSCCWFGINSWYGGQVVKVMIGAIWPSFHLMPNNLPVSAGAKTNELVSFFIFWAICMVLILLRPERYNIPMLFACVIVTITMFVIFIWAVVKQGNAGPLWNNPDDVFGAELSGSEVSWTIMWMVTRGVGSWASGILNQSDLTRYAKRHNDQVWGQVFVAPIVSLCANILGIVTTSCARGFYPDEPLLWKLYDLLYAVQRHEGRTARVAVFFCALALFLSALPTAIVAAAIVGGIDLSVLLPRYINIRRGAYIVSVVGVLIQPWRILNTANSFITTLSGYATFFGPLTGIMLAEYHIVRQRRINLSHLFIPSPSSDYWFWHGLNWRAPVAWVLGVFPILPGFAASINTTIRVNVIWMHIYHMSWFLGLFVSGIVWLVLNTIWPPPDPEQVKDDDVPGPSAFKFGQDDKQVENGTASM